MTDHPAPGRRAATDVTTGATDVTTGATDVTTGATDIAAGATAAETTDATAPGPGDLYEAEMLVEEVSIDGMCGVY